MRFRVIAQAHPAVFCLLTCFDHRDLDHPVTIVQLAKGVPTFYFGPNGPKLLIFPIGMGDGAIAACSCEEGSGGYQGFADYELNLSAMAQASLSYDPYYAERIIVDPINIDRYKQVIMASRGVRSDKAAGRNCHRGT